MKSNRIILGLDPGTNLMGFGIIKKSGEKLKAIQYGVIKMNKEKNHLIKLKMIFDSVNNLIDEFNPNEISIELKKNILEMAFSAGASSSHLGGALSIVDIMSVLFSQKMKLNNDPKWGDRDRFILSKGHACLAYYAALCEKGYIEKKELQTFEKDDSNLLGHPVINKKL